MATIIESIPVGREQDPVKPDVLVSAQEVAESPIATIEEPAVDRPQTPVPHSEESALAETPATPPGQTAATEAPTDAPETDQTVKTIDTAEAESAESDAEVGDAPPPQVYALAASRSAKRAPTKKYPKPNPPKKEPDFTIQPYPKPGKGEVDILPIHPAPPSGNVLDDVRTHVQCQNWFVHSVGELIEAYQALKIDNEKKNRDIIQLGRDNNRLRLDLQSTQKDLDGARADLEKEQAGHKATKERLNKANIEIVSLTGKVDTLTGDLRNARSELNQANREKERLKREIEYRDERIRELESKLKESNDSEDRANDRVTELQRYIYSLEQKRALIERQKDAAELKNRVLEGTYGVTSK